MMGLLQRLDAIDRGEQVFGAVAELLELVAQGVRAGVVTLEQKRTARSEDNGAAWTELKLGLPLGWFVRLEVGKGRG